MCNINNTANTPREMDSFEINGYHVFYRLKNFMLDTGVRLMDTTAEYGDDERLLNTFRQLLPYDVDAKMIFTVKLTPISPAKFYSQDFDNLMMNLEVQNLKMFLLHYPASPNSEAKDRFGMRLQIQSWIAVSKLEDLTKINAVGVYQLSKKHLIHLTEVVTVGPMVHQMRWYYYYNYTCTQQLRSNMDVIYQPLVGTLARHYNVPAAQILMLWTLQRGETIIPNLTTSGFSMENLNLNMRLNPIDLSSLDILILRLNSINGFI